MSKELPVIRESKVGSIKFKPVAKVIAGSYFRNVHIKKDSIDSGLHVAAREGLVDLVDQHIQKDARCLNQLDFSGFSALHYAARYNRVKVVQLLLEQGAEINIENDEGVTPLHLAAKYNCQDVTQILIKRGALFGAKDHKGKTALHNAARRGNSAISKILLLADNCDVNICDYDNMTPLHDVAIHGDLKTCQLLISNGANILAKEVNDMTPLMIASAEGHLQIMKALLDAASRQFISYSDYLKNCDNEGDTSLHMACQNGKLEAVKLLLQNGANPNSQKVNLSTPLHIAANHGFVDIAKELLTHKASVDARDAEHLTPMHRAAVYNKVPIMQIFLNEGADINAKDMDNFTPLHCSCWKGHSQVAEFLLGNGAQITAVDSDMKTCLHWAVECAHYETLLSVLGRGGVNLIEARDKADQTVLHLAASVGNVAIIKTLLDFGAKTDAKDCEEKTPLHIAAENDSVGCIESLIEASISEVNDDDIDGRTPLMLASANGHYASTKLLIALEGDVSKRDETKQTSLMLASSNGHTQVMDMLIENHAEINATDKKGNSALHLASSNGHAAAVVTLLDHHGDVTKKNLIGETPLDCAINQQQNDVAIAILEHKNWKDAMNVLDDQGKNPLTRLIKTLPAAAEVVMDHCITESDEMYQDCSKTFDFSLLDPGPNVMSTMSRRYESLYCMVKCNRETLLSHPLVQQFLMSKWKKFARTYFYSYLAVYLCYLVCLNIFTVSATKVKPSPYLDYYGCPIYLNENETNNATLIQYYIENGHPSWTANVEMTDWATAIGSSLTVFIILIILKEAARMYTYRLKYFIDLTNYLSLIIVITTLIFMSPPDKVACTNQWRAGWMSIFFTWINIIMFLRRIEPLGIYVIMFIAVLKSLLKILLLLLMFVLAFGSAFYIILHNVAIFEDETWSYLTTFIMTVGELDFESRLFESNTVPFTVDAVILFMVFVVVMPIALMNLLVGVAVGDIEKIQEGAFVERLSMQVELIYEAEMTMPPRLRKYFYEGSRTLQTNQNSNSLYQKFQSHIFGITKASQFIAAETPDHTLDALTDVKQALQKQNEKIQSLEHSMRKQLELLASIRGKLNNDANLDDDKFDQLSHVSVKTAMSSRPRTADRRNLKTPNILKR